MSILRRSLGSTAIAIALVASAICLTPPAQAQDVKVANPDLVNGVVPHEPYPVSARAKAIHATIPVTDLHADPLLWNRDLVVRNTIGHIDFPRLKEGGYALQLFSVVSSSPNGANYVKSSMSNGDVMETRAKRDGWPHKTWHSVLERALYAADKLYGFEERSNGAMRIVRTQGDLQRAMHDRVLAGILLSEGAHPLEGKLSNIPVMYNAGFRVLALTHFFDNQLGGSLHGESQAGLTPFGKSVIPAAEKQGLIIDVAHSSEAMVRDTIAIAKHPVIVSHTGVKGYCDTPRNISDETMKLIADHGGLIGVGFWDAAICKPTMKNSVEALVYAVKLLGPEHVALGTDMDGGVPEPFDSSEMAGLTSALLDAGMDEKTVRMVMGENAIRFFSTYLPKK